MPAKVSELKITDPMDPEIKEKIRAVIEVETAHLSNNYRVAVKPSATNDEWEIRIIKPDGSGVSKKLDGASGEHQPEKVRQCLQQLLAEL
jgi:hypothetical protein